MGEKRRRMREAKDRKKKIAMEKEKERKLLEQDELNKRKIEESQQESDRERELREKEMAEQARLERLRLETLRKLNDEHSTKLKKFVKESRNLPTRIKSKSTIDNVSSEARRQSMAVGQAEKDIKEGNKALQETCTKITKLETSIASLDWELERYEIEKMKAKTEKVMKRMSSYVTVKNGFGHGEN